MPFDNLTLADAQRITDALEQLAQSKQTQANADAQARIDLVKSWWDTVKPAVPTTRREAMDVINKIKDLLKTETDRDRLSLLSNKLTEANIKYHDIKDVNPNS